VTTLTTKKTTTTKETSTAVLPLQTLLTLDKDSIQNQVDRFYPQAWGLISFLLNSEKREYNRFIWDALSLLKPGATLEENSQAVLKHFTTWFTEEQFKTDFTEYIKSLKTYNELITEGVEYYTKQEWSKASENLEKATVLQPDDYVAYYYLGLIYYEQKEYTKAEEFYSQAFHLGAETGLTNYALGVNAFANNQFDKANSYLQEAKKANPGIYSSKVDPLLERISTLR
jgi:tetratricopeptide (TPR) repeat protein